MSGSARMIVSIARPGSLDRAANASIANFHPFFDRLAVLIDGQGLFNVQGWPVMSAHRGRDQAEPFNSQSPNSKQTLVSQLVRACSARGPLSSPFMMTAIFFPCSAVRIWFKSVVLP